jgi:hypothetical protein
MYSFRDQKKFIESLIRFENKMEGKEREFFSSVVKRHKDDEDLDSLSFSKLKELYEKYYVNRKKPNLDDLFKKN